MNEPTGYEARYRALVLQKFNLDKEVARLKFQLSNLQNDVDFQSLFMQEIANFVGMPVEGKTMSDLSQWIQENWKG